MSVCLEDTPPPENRLCIVHRQIIGKNDPANATVTTLNYFPLPSSATGAIKLVIKAEGVRYLFGWAIGTDADVAWVGDVDSKWLSAAPDGYFLFKGAQFGIYAQGGERNMLQNPADFKCESFTNSLWRAGLATLSGSRQISSSTRLRDSREYLVGHDIYSSVFAARSNPSNYQCRPGIAASRGL